MIKKNKTQFLKGNKEKRNKSFVCLETCPFEKLIDCGRRALLILSVYDRQILCVDYTKQNEDPDQRVTPERSHCRHW